jgi:peptidoglycan hydrolase-like protein with peptidoglycan-binding domain
MIEGKAPPDRQPGHQPPGHQPPGWQESQAFKESVAGLARRLGERMAEHSSTDPIERAAARRAALRAYDQARTRRRKLMVALALAALAPFAGAGIAALVSAIDAPAVSDAPSSSAASLEQPAPSPQELAAAPAPPPAEPAVPPASPTPTPAAAPAATPVAAPTMASTPSPAPVESAAAPPTAPEAAPTPLQRSEIKEVQAKLRTFGFNPGPVDGNAGPMTQAAVLHYQQNRGQPETGKVDRAVLDELRQDPAPPVAQRPAVVQAAAQYNTPAAGPPARRSRSADPFEPVREAGDNIGRWLQSLMR